MRWPDTTEYPNKGFPGCSRSPALAGGQLPTGPPHGLAGLNLHGGARGRAGKVLRGRGLLGDLLDQPAHPLLLLLLGDGQQQQVLGRRHVVVD